MIQFPSLMYKCPGQNRKPCGATFNFVGVDSQAQFDAMKAKGWLPTFEQAKEVAGESAYPKVKKFNRFDGKKAKAKKPSKPLTTYVERANIKARAETEAKIDLVSAPNRLELETKAIELGIKFDGRTTDKKLLDKIEQTLGANDVMD